MGMILSYSKLIRAVQWHTIWVLPCSKLPQVDQWCAISCILCISSYFYMHKLIPKGQWHPSTWFKASMYAQTSPKDLYLFCALVTVSILSSYYMYEPPKCISAQTRAPKSLCMFRQAPKACHLIYTVETRGKGIVY